MTPGPSAGFADACRAVCPEFRASGPPQHARKSELLRGMVGSIAVIAKRLRRPNAVWAWYMAREIAIYRAFARKPPPVRVPRLVAASDALLVIEALPGEPLSTRRHASADLPVATVERLVAMREALATWDGLHGAADDPPPPVKRQLRERFLEDPTAPLAWITDGIARAGRRDLIAPALAARAGIAVAGHAPIAFGHGDLLLRNVVGDGLVDWECAGPHVHDWDLALLWSQLAPAARPPLEAHVATDGARRAAFVGLCVFALAREVKYLHSFGTPSPHRLRELRGELAVLAEQLG